jgi:hypothetical protein
MTAPTKPLASRAQQVARRSDGMARVAANCVFVALGYSPSPEVARDVLGELERPDVRKAAIELLDQLAVEAAART